MSAQIMVAASGLVLLGLGATARAAEDTAAEATEEAKRHEAELNKGKSHEDARAAAHMSKDGDAAAQEAKRHEAELNKGKSHEDARSAASASGKAKAAKRAKRHQAELDKGKSHEDARSASDEEDKAAHSEPSGTPPK